VVVTNYETVIRDVSFFKKLTWKYLVIDEGHRIKNIECRLVRELTKLPTLNRLLLTGTPLQNNLAELWSLLHFLLPDIFDDLASFESWFDRVDTHGSDHGDSLKEDQIRHVVASLHSILKPFLLRRLKSDVLRLPEKREFVVRCPPTRLQSTLLAAIEGGMLRECLAPACDDLGRQRLQGATMQARKVCNDPRLFHYRTATTADSGKMLVLLQLVRRVKERGKKCLVFSQMTTVLDIIEGELVKARISRVRIDGAVAEADRQSAITRFNDTTTTSSTTVFLLTTRSGGLGLNLTAATHAFIYDADWNPQADRQAADRVHRIGQASAVTVIRLRVAGSVEEGAMAAVAGEKERLERRVICRRRFKGRSDYLAGTETAPLPDDDTITTTTNTTSTSTSTTAPSNPLLSEQELDYLVDGIGDAASLPSTNMIQLLRHSTTLLDS
jgi:ATP-dependent DNA helicase